MSDVTPGATPTEVPTATVTPTAAPAAPAAPVIPAAPQGATPTPITPDTAARIAELESQLQSANSRIRELNGESKGHRLKAESLNSVNETLTALGLKPEELKDTLEQAKGAIAERDALKREKTINETAGALGLKPNALLKSLLKDVDLRVDGEGEARKIMVKSGDVEKAWDDFLKERPELQDAMPALAVEDAGQQQQRREPPPSEAARRGSNDTLMGADEMAAVAQRMGLSMPKAAA